MNVPFIRYIATSNAGNARRLYCAVRCAMDLQVDDQELLWEIFVERCSRCQSLGYCWRGGKKPRPRSAEPHFAFARELDMIEWRYRWLPTLGSGVAYLRLWEAGRRPPKYFLVAKLLEYDRAFLVPFLKYYIEGDPPADAAAKAWSLVWKNFGDALAAVDPPLPEKPDERTKEYHSRTRLGLLEDETPDGICLSKDQLEGIIREFKECAGSSLPDDLFFRISRALDGTKPDEMNAGELARALKNAFPLLKGAGYASARAAYAFINEISLPTKAISWSAFHSILRRVEGVQLRSSFRTEDVLFKIGEDHV